MNNNNREERLSAFSIDNTELKEEPLSEVYINGRDQPERVHRAVFVVPPPPVYRGLFGKGVSRDPLPTPAARRQRSEIPKTFSKRVKREPGLPPSENDGEAGEEEKYPDSPPPLGPVGPVEPNPAEEWLKAIAPEKLQYGGDWFAQLRFVRMLQDVCSIPVSQFDFDTWRIYTYFTPNRRPSNPEGPEMRRMLEWFGMLGYYIVWTWQRVNHSRQKSKNEPFTLWELIDNSSTLTNFVALIQLAYTAAVDDRGLKDPGRANARSRELQRNAKLLTLARSYPSGVPRDKAVEVQLEMPPLYIAPPPRRDLTDVEQLMANKHLLLKWCAQASGVNTTTAAYRIEEEKIYSDRETDSSKPYLVVKLEDPIPTMEPLPQFMRVNTDPIHDTSILNTADWKRANPGRVAPQAPQPAPAPVAPNTMTTFEVSINSMDVNVKQMYRQGIENLRDMSGNTSTSQEVEYRLLMRSTLCDQIFFAQYCSILSATYRGYNHRSRLAGVVRNKLSTEWDGLQLYFKRWASESK